MKEVFEYPKHILEKRELERKIFDVGKALDSNLCPHLSTHFRRKFEELLDRYRQVCALEQDSI